uniref:Uncharacterized protein n=1 Tax=Myotis myotis TaxID=51298 RepID=A0A7J7ZXE2_MYOMY|nr:hypothetical protein mMyoMyo1_009661 [Myotis myotis]
MAGPEDRRPVEGQTHSVFFLTLLICLQPGLGNPYLARNYSWEVTRTIDGTVIGSVVGTGAPVIPTDLCKLFEENWGNSRSKTASTGCGSGGHPRVTKARGYRCGDLALEQELWHTRHYVCPQEGGSNCGGEGDFYCASWGCETLAPWKKPPTDKLLRLKREVRPGALKNCTIGNCNPVLLVPLAWWTDQWEGGKTWGLRLYVSGRDPGQLFTIQRRTLPQWFNLIGPLRPLNKPERPSQPQHPAPAKPGSPGSQSSGSPSPTPPAAMTSPALGDLQQLLDTGCKVNGFIHPILQNLREGR